MKCNIVNVTPENIDEFYDYRSIIVGDVVAVFDIDGVKRISMIESEGGKEFYRVYNPYNKYEIGIVRKYRFWNRIGDAIRAVRDGYGDEIVQGINSCCYSVRHYIDREYGEKVREETLKKYSNSEIFYTLEYRYVYPTVDDNVTVYTKDEYNNKLMYFKNESEADAVVYMICISIAGLLHRVCTTPDISGNFGFGKVILPKCSKFANDFVLVGTIPENEDNADIHTLFTDARRSVRIVQHIKMDSYKV